MTGVPMLLNTSFNENEPIVLTPAQALDCFLRTSMDVLVDRPSRARACASAGGADRRGGREAGDLTMTDLTSKRVVGHRRERISGPARRRPRLRSRAARSWCRARRSTTSRARPTSSACTPSSRPMS